MFTSLWHSRHLGYDLQGSPVRSPSAALVENWCLGFFLFVEVVRRVRDLVFDAHMEGATLPIVPKPCHVQRDD